ncbi:MAG: hypothetical protein JSW28_02410 [Thermoplasmata archaeon]|nr:MAG: hypothetical protein JSW28_02410 [Thermoplasmata archaeon]
MRERILNLMIHYVGLIEPEAVDYILKLNFTHELLEETITDQGDVYEILIEIELVEAGEFFPQFGAIGFTDSSNEYSYETGIT